MAFVTGAGQGVGVGLAIALAKAGASVALFGRTRATLEETARKIQAFDGRALVCPGDVTIRENVDAAIERDRARSGTGLGSREQRGDR